MILIKIFIIRFLVSNVWISLIIMILLCTKIICKNILSSRMHYRLWLLLLGMLSIPFLPIQRTLSLTNFNLTHTPVHIFSNTIVSSTFNFQAQIQDFALSVDKQTASSFYLILTGLWIFGMSSTVIYLANSYRQWCVIQKTASVLSHQEIETLYQQCLAESKIKKAIPLYKTMHLTSPVITGLFHPRIYLPEYLLCDLSFKKLKELRFMFLHELQHYKQNDALITFFVNVISIIYWFNPFVRYALKQLKTEREISCDSSVLYLLSPEERIEYGHALLHIAAVDCHSPFVSGISGSTKQLKKRINSIIDYKKPSRSQKWKSFIVFLLVAILLFMISPVLSTYAQNADKYNWNTKDKQLSTQNFDSEFGQYSGSFVLYHLETDNWILYQPDEAVKRYSPNSTYKPYCTLIALENKIITPDHSTLLWNQTLYPFEEWNQDQTMYSAMASSVNWYFQTLDQKSGLSILTDFYRQIDYGNQDISSGLDKYWMESSLKISAVEQVELLKNFYLNSFDFQEQNVQAVKQALLLISQKDYILYGKTGTGRVNEKDINGWFIGFVESLNGTYFFAANIHADCNATGSQASDITLQILSKMGIADH